MRVLDKSVWLLVSLLPILLVACGIFVGSTEEPNGLAHGVSEETNSSLEPWVTGSSGSVVTSSESAVASSESMATSSESTAASSESTATSSESTAGSRGSSSSMNVPKEPPGYGGSCSAQDVPISYGISFASAPTSSASTNSGSSSTDSGSSGVSLDDACKTFGSILWRGDAEMYRVETGDAEAKAGYWYTYTDCVDGGASGIKWPIEIGNSYSDDSMEPIIDACAGLCGDYVLERGTLNTLPFVAVAINVGGIDDTDTPIPLDVTAWGGLCVAYTSDDDIRLEMGLGSALNQMVGYDLPSVYLPKTAMIKYNCFKWGEFFQKGDTSVIVDGDDAATKLVSLRFVIQGLDGSSGKFNIMALGSFELLE